MHVFCLLYPIYQEDIGSLLVKAIRKKKFINKKTSLEGQQRWIEKEKKVCFRVPRSGGCFVIQGHIYKQVILTRQIPITLHSGA